MIKDRVTQKTSADVEPLYLKVINNPNDLVIACRNMIRRQLMEECRGFEEADDIIFDLEREIALATEKLTREDLQKPKNWEEATDRIVKENLIRADERASLIAKIDGKIGELNDSKSPYGEKALNRSGFNHSEIEDQIKVLIDLKGLLDTEKAITDKGCESIKPMSLPHKRVKGHAEISKGKGVERE